MSIQARQNRPESLARLAAQRFLYRRAKVVRIVGLGLIVLVVILGLAASVVDNKGFSQLIPYIVLITWFVDQQVLKRKESALKTEAATIQEYFDCYVFDLPWPHHKGVMRPTEDRVNQLSRLAERSPQLTSELADWYTPNAIPDDPILAVIHCQRMNCWYDVSLRQKWIRVLKILFWIIAVLVLGLSVLTGITVAKLAAITASNIRVLAWGLDENGNQGAAMQRIRGIHRTLSNLTDNRPISPSSVRYLQDDIFEYRRSNPPVPDWFYWLKRNRQEVESAVSCNKRLT